MKLHQKLNVRLNISDIFLCNLYDECYFFHRERMYGKVHIWHYNDLNLRYYLIFNFLNRKIDLIVSINLSYINLKTKDKTETHYKIIAFSNKNDCVTYFNVKFNWIELFFCYFFYLNKITIFFQK